MPFQKLDSFTQKVSDLQDKPALTASELKAAFDAAPDEVRVYLNQLIDALTSTTSDDSGAENIGTSAITGVSGSNVQTVLESLKTQLDNVSVGQIKNTSLTANQALIPTGNTGTIEQLISWITNRIQIITGATNWYDPILQLAKKQQENWTDAVMQNFWVGDAGKQARYYKDEMGHVHVEGELTGGTTTDGTVMFTLPTGCRPEKDIVWGILTYDGGLNAKLSEVKIQTNGQVRLSKAASQWYIKLGHLVFRAYQ